jgi:hypothetical protein
MAKNISADDVASLCFVAFGVGAASQQAGIEVDLEAIQAMRGDYYETITCSASVWQKYERVVLDSARDFGSLCARIAISDKKNVRSIKLDHYYKAKKEFYCVCMNDLQKMLSK